MLADEELIVSGSDMSDEVIHSLEILIEMIEKASTGDLRKGRC